MQGQRWMVLWFKQKKEKSPGGLALLDARCPPSHSITPLLSRTEREKTGWKNPFGSRGRLFNKAKAKAVCGPKENEIYIICFPSADGEYPVSSQDIEYVVSEGKAHKKLGVSHFLLLFLGFYMKFWPPGNQTRSTHYRSSSV